MTAHLEMATTGIALITLDNPPVNDLDLTRRAALAECFATVRHDARIRGAVLRETGRNILSRQ